VTLPGHDGLSMPRIGREQFMVTHEMTARARH